MDQATIHENSGSNTLGDTQLTEKGRQSSEQFVIRNIPDIDHTEDRQLNENGPQPTKASETGYQKAPNTTIPIAKKAAKEWRALPLKSWFIILLLVLESSMIDVILYLDRRSAARNGIVSVPEVSSATVSSIFSISNIWNYGLLWTTLPSLVMTLHKFAWDAVVSGSADRQAFIELSRDEKRAATAEVTIMLDYKSYPVLYSWYVAFSNSHVLIGCSMVLSLILSIAIIPLSAHLFVPARSQSKSTLDLRVTSSFNESALASHPNLQPAFDLATSHRVYGASPPPWMTSEYAFESFSIGDVAAVGNVTFPNATAYSAYLDCITFNASESGATFVDSASVHWNTTDRGCQISNYETTIKTISTYTVSWVQPCFGTDYNRIGMFAGIYSETSPLNLANYTLVSCIPTYWKKTGTLTVSIQPNGSPQYISFKPRTTTSILLIFRGEFETLLAFYTYNDPSGSVRADLFCFSVFSYARRINPISPITTELIKDAMEDMFTTVYAGSGINLLLQPNASLSIIEGTLSVPVSRLYVVSPVAYTIVAVLALILLCNIALFIYSETHCSSLVEDPKGLLGSAVLLDQGNISTFVADFVQKHPEQTYVRKYVENNFDVAGSQCYFEKGTRRIQIKTLTEKT